MKYFFSALFLINLFIGNYAVAKSPTIKPDWNNVTDYSVNLSGTKVTYTLPGMLSSDFPQTKARNANLFDFALYSGRPFFKLAESYWDYRSRKFFFLDTLGTLQFHISVVKINSDLDGDIRKQSIFMDLTKRRLNSEKQHNNNAEETLKLIQFSQGEWLNYNLKREPAHPDKNVYLIAIDKGHYLQVSFTIISSVDHSRDDWYERCLLDIERIMESFVVRASNY